MSNHICVCTKIAREEKQDYLEMMESFRTPKASGTDKSSQGTISQSFMLRLSKKDMARIEDQMLKAVVATNSSYNALCNPEFTKLFYLLNPSFQPPGRTKLRTSILD